MYIFYYLDLFILFFFILYDCISWYYFWIWWCYICDLLIFLWLVYFKCGCICYWWYLVFDCNYIYFCCKLCCICDLIVVFLLVYFRCDCIFYCYLLVVVYSFWLFCLLIWLWGLMFYCICCLWIGDCLFVVWCDFYCFELICCNKCFLL